MFQRQRTRWNAWNQALQNLHCSLCSFKRNHGSVLWMSKTAPVMIVHILCVKIINSLCRKDVIESQADEELEACSFYSALSNKMQVHFYKTTNRPPWIHQCAIRWTTLTKRNKIRRNILYDGISFLNFPQIVRRGLRKTSQRPLSVMNDPLSCHREGLLRSQAFISRDKHGTKFSISPEVAFQSVYFCKQKAIDTNGALLVQRASWTELNDDLIAFSSNLYCRTHGISHATFLVLDTTGFVIDGEEGIKEVGLHAMLKLLQKDRQHETENYRTLLLSVYLSVNCFHIRIQCNKDNENYSWNEWEEECVSWER